MENYKSWGGLNKQLTEALCDELKNRITYFLTRYHTVHNSYGRAAIRLDGEELVVFSWVETYHRESDISELHKTGVQGSYDDMERQMKSAWDAACTYSEMNFLDAALKFRSMAIKDALESENYIVKIFAILDRRVGKRTIAQIKEAKEYERYPEWVQQFYRLRLS